MPEPGGLGGEAAYPVWAISGARRGANAVLWSGADSGLFIYFLSDGSVASITELQTSSRMEK